MSRVSAVLALLAAALLAPWGCAAPPPPASSLPGKLAVESARTDDAVREGASQSDVPAAVPPSEGQLSPAKPEPDDGAGTLLVYTAITGRPPFAPDLARAQAPLGKSWTAASEEERGRALEAEIEQEMRRQQQALESLEAPESAQPDFESLVSSQQAAERANPRVAPDAPAPRELPISVFEITSVTIAANSWDNDEPLSVKRGVLDADGDGNPEQIRFFEPGSMQLLRVEEDSNYDGSLDSWSSYQQGALRSRVRDTNGDDRPDIWERYENDRMAERTIDRDHDGVADAFYVYADAILVEERHDANNDGAVDRRIFYEKLFRVRAEEDRNLDGQIDVWTSYGVVQGKEVIERVEQSTKGSGPPDRIESYDASSGEPQLAKLEEDRDGNGTMDVISHYKNGKLVQREISDPNLAPL